MEIVLFFFWWLVMAIICAMVAGSKRGAGVALAFFFYGLLIWPIALVHALLLRAREEPPPRAEGVINGRPYWRTRDGRFCANIDGRDVAFPDQQMLETALNGKSADA